MFYGNGKLILAGTAGIFSSIQVIIYKLILAGTAGIFSSIQVIIYKLILAGTAVRVYEIFYNL